MPPSELPPSKPKVLLTDMIDAEGAALLEPHAELIVAEDCSVSGLYSAVKDVDGIIVRCNLPHDIADHAPRLRGMVRHGVGLDFIPVEAATQAGIAVANLPGSNTTAVVEYCVSAIFHLARPLAALDRDFRRNGWQAARTDAESLRELHDLTLGVLGVGAVGSKVAELASKAFNMTVIGTSRPSSVLPDYLEKVGLEELFARSDIVLVTCALTPETRGIVNAERISRMKAGAHIINAARGAVIETGALIKALQEERLAGAVLDVYDVHPLPAGDELLSLPNLILTPHLASITRSSLRAMGIGAAQEMLRILQSKDPLFLVNPDYRKFARTQPEHR